MLSPVWWSPPSRFYMHPMTPRDDENPNPRWRHRSLRSARCWSYAKLNEEAWMEFANPAPPPCAGFFVAKTERNRGKRCDLSFEQKDFLKWRGQDLFRRIKTVIEDKCSNRNGSWGGEHWVVTVSEMYSLNLFIQGKGATPNLWLFGVAYYWTSENPQIYSTWSVHACTCILVFCLETCMCFYMFACIPIAISNSYYYLFLRSYRPLEHTPDTASLGLSFSWNLRSLWYLLWSCTHSLKLTVCHWKIVVGRRFFPFGATYRLAA